MYRNVKKDAVFLHTRRVIIVPNLVSVVIKKNRVFVTGILGTLVHVLHALVIIQIDNIKNVIMLCTEIENSMSKAIIGTTKSLLCGMIVGVSKGFSKKLQLVGIGYRVSIVNGVINLIIGLSHVVNYKLPTAVQAKCENQTEIVLSSINKQLLGQVAADLRSIRPPEPFKGKGIRYVDEIVRNKDTKKK